MLRLNVNIRARDAKVCLFEPRALRAFPDAPTMIGARGKRSRRRDFPLDLTEIRQRARVEFVD